MDLIEFVKLVSPQPLQCWQVAVLEAIQRADTGRLRLPFRDTTTKSMTLALCRKVLAAQEAAAKAND